MSSWITHLLLLFYIAQTPYSLTLSNPSLNVHQRNENTFVDDVGIFTVTDIQNASHRQLISSASCANPPYTSSCTNTNPDNCPCNALTDLEKQQILDAHNTRRDLAASGNEDCATSTGTLTKCPSATNMNYLFWDNGLETVSTYWAHQCIWGHHQNIVPNEQYTMFQAQCDSNQCLAVGYSGNAIGENLYASGTGGTPNWNIETAVGGIHAWFDESSQYYFADRTSFGVTGHWTQGVWAKTRYIGCGYAACPGNGPFSDSITAWLNVVCKYYPAGNYPSHPYESGGKCTQCDTDRNGCVGDNSGLCGGGQCKECAVDFNQNTCLYNDSSCPSAMLCSDNIGREMNCEAIASGVNGLWDEKSESALVAGIVGSFFALVTVLNAIGFVLYCIVKKKGNFDTELSESSSMVGSISGNKLLLFVTSGFVLFLLPPISFAFVKSNVVLGEGYNPQNSCESGWFLEYFGYECGKLMLEMFLIYRIWTAFDNSMYHLPKKHIMHIFLKAVPALFLLYFILILFAFLLKDQFAVIVTVNESYLYCGFDGVSAVFVFGHIISFIREIGFNAIILYWFIYRLHDMNQNANEIKNEGHYTKKKIRKMSHENTEKKAVKVAKKRKKKVSNQKLSKKDIIWNGYICEFGSEPKSAPQLQQWAKSDKNGDNATNLTYKQAKDMFSEYGGKGTIGESEIENETEAIEGDSAETEGKKKKKKSSVSIDIEKENLKTENKLRKKKQSKDSTFNMQNRRGLIIKYVILIVIMFVSSFICQILLCFREYPSFYVSWDIIIQCICCILLLWFGTPIWSKIMEVFGKICLCHVCCPVLIKQTL